MRLEYFEMLDRIDAFDREKRHLKAVSGVPLVSTVFEGHFPGQPIMPGALLLETMAQASGYLLLALDDFVRMPYFVGCKLANFRAFVDPGSRLDVEASCVHLGAGYAMTQASIRKGGAVVCDAELKFRQLPVTTPSLRGFINAQGMRLGLFQEARTAHE
jgi:3-hydroxyacyl-[acyl-carrier-protein] dehydratase